MNYRWRKPGISFTITPVGYQEHIFFHFPYLKPQNPEGIPARYGKNLWQEQKNSIDTKNEVTPFFAMEKLCGRNKNLHAPVTRIWGLSRTIDDFQLELCMKQLHDKYSYLSLKGSSFSQIVENFAFL